ncbi:sodium/myo-inositol cotransporter-like isoform X1 [Entelurus aequoreus]|uniref:sodium/myo-inositol cotransporter-like isoform X1 n=1 Tax=Entelurus aequoreus TaxID=161455 RepID=UPI002B1E1A29|nr:sodium/myo-inositol cotransporter-like isoform X1 [Entelurus aequoreus]XP_061917614.1 sodium/myo-inositol cotransporter-like isoform X1 [Entelurus aequoreus]
MTGNMEVADILVVAGYFIVVLAIGFLAMCKPSRNTVKGYFLAGRSMNWAAVGASLFVSNIGSEHFIGLAGSGAASGLGVAAWELNALLLLQLSGWIFAPVYIYSGVFTMPEYLSKRFGGRRLKVYFAVLSLILYPLTKISVDLYAGALFIRESLGWNLYLSIILLIALTALLTVTGGLVAVIYTDVLQAALMVTGAVCLMCISFYKVGGIGGMMTKYMQAAPNITAILLSSPNLTYSESCHHYLNPKPDALKILRGPKDPDLPWPGFLLGQTPASIWYWCTDQVVMQRILAAKNIAHAKGSTVMAGFLKILPMFVIVIPGMISRIYFADELVCISPEHCMEVCGSTSGCTNVAYPRLVMAMMPVGLRGLMMAVMIAALMSDLDSIFNSASTIFTLDIYKMLRKRASSRELVIVGKLFVVFMVIVSIGWVPVIIEMQGGQMFYYTQEIANYLTPPIAAVFLLGVLWHRCNEKGAFWGGVVGFVLGLLRLVLAYVYREPHCSQPDERPAFIKDVHFMYVAAILFWVTALVTAVVSLCTPSPRTEQIRTTTWWGLNQRKLDQKEKPGEEINLKKVNGDEEGPLVQNGGQVVIPEPKMREKADCEWQEEGGSREAAGECSNKLFQWFLGFQETPPTAQAMTAQDHEKLVDELLNESPKTKIILNVGMVTICCIGIFLLIFFSV